MSDLTPKQEMFCREYLIDLNGTQAAIRAGYSPKTANEQAAGLLAKPSIQEYVQSLMDRRAKRIEVTADMVLDELRKIGFADIRKAVKWGIAPLDFTSENASPNGLNIYPVSLVPSETIDEDTVAAVAEISLTQAGVKLKMHDKLSALEKLGKHLKLFTDKVENQFLDKDGKPADASVTVKYI